MRELSSIRLVVLVDDYAGFTEGLLGEHGFSTLVELRYSDGLVKRVLFDTGATSRVLLFNARRLGLDLGLVDYVVVSHRHWDHTGGIPGVAKVNQKATVIAHPGILEPAYSAGEQGLRYIGLTDESRRALERFRTLLTKSAFELAPGTWFLGEVERYYDNKYAVKGFKKLREGELVDDSVLDDTGMAIRLGSTTLVLAGCSHSGISNIVRKARKAAGGDELVVLGGLHLANADAETVSRVVSELENEGVEEVYAGHCTGLRGEAELLKVYGDRMRKIHSGFTITAEAE
ncbi:MBL fold metallo-hydrolase [Thermogladius sp.]|uniref:MBL fold metallo-hydrolase n=1 Tax=Thermogladius sp. TaxID=2023064 RepID=UPI003D0B9CDC